MKIAVLLKFFRGELNPFDGAALECALEYGGEITVISMAPPSAEEPLKTLARLGARAILISDPAYAGSDTLATSYVLAEAIGKLSPDVVFAGRQSMDGDTAQVPPMLAQRLGMNMVSGVMEFDQGSIKTRNGAETVLTHQTIYTFERIRTLRFPSVFSPRGAVERWSQADLSLDGETCGMRGSPTRVLRSYESAVGRRNCKFSAVSDFDAIIKAAMTKESGTAAKTYAPQTECIYYVGSIGNIAQKYAKTAIPIEAHGKSAEAFSDAVRALDARIVLFEANEEYRALAARSAVILGAGLCADCISFRAEEGAFIMTRPAIGGNVTADIVSLSGRSFATVRPVECRGEDIVFSIGKGAVPYLNQMQALADRYGAELTCTRAVADSGTLPYRCQVGVTGKTVSPRLYVAFGISGAVQHTSAIVGAQTVLAINTDKDARIFDYSDYGIVCDIKNLFEEK
jgi:electron transfer flavoprotein alpha subunit